MVDNYICSLLSCKARIRSLFSVKMALKKWDDSQQVTDFKQPPKKTRFKHPVKDEEILELSKGFVPANMEKNTMWAFKVFSDYS